MLDVANLVIRGAVASAISFFVILFLASVKRMVEHGQVRARRSCAFQCWDVGNDTCCRCVLRNICRANRKNLFYGQVWRLTVSAMEAAIAIIVVIQLVFGLSRMKRIYMHKKLGK